MALAVRVVAGQHHDPFDAAGLEFRQPLPGAVAHRVGDEDHADEPVVSGNMGRRATAVVDRGVERDPRPDTIQAPRWASQSKGPLCA